MRSRLRRIRSVAVIGILAVAYGGCVRAPVVQLTGVRLAGLGLRGATLVAQLRVDNPNGFAITADSVAFQLEASHPGETTSTWTRVTSGTNAQQHRIEKKGATHVEIPIEFPYAGLGTPIRALLDKGMFNYRLTGKVFVHAPLRRAVPFSQTGSLTL